MTIELTTGGSLSPFTLVLKGQRTTITRQDPGRPPENRPATHGHRKASKSLLPRPEGQPDFAMPVQSNRGDSNDEAPSPVPHLSSSRERVKHIALNALKPAHKSPSKIEGFSTERNHLETIAHETTVMCASPTKSCVFNAWARSLFMHASRLTARTTIPSSPNSENTARGATGRMPKKSSTPFPVRRVHVKVSTVL